MKWIFCLLPACIPTSALRAAGAIEDALPEQVGQCEYLGPAIGSAGNMGRSSFQQGMNRAMLKARLVAAEEGATHLVWAPAEARGYVSTVNAAAYRCPVTE